MAVQKNVDLLSLPGIYLDLDLRDPLEGVLTFLNGGGRGWLKNEQQRQSIMEFFEELRATQMSGPLQREECRPEFGDAWAKRMADMAIEPTLIGPQNLVWLPSGHKGSRGQVGLELALFRLMETGQLARIEKCACGCGVWIIRKRRNTKFASEKCRWAFRSLPTVREKRAKKAREDYLDSLAKPKKAKLVAKRERRLSKVTGAEGVVIGKRKG